MKDKYTTGILLEPKESFVDKYYKWVYTSPALFFVCLLMVFPVCYTFVISFTDWSLTSGRPMQFVGFKSYLAVFKEPRFWAALKRTLVFSIFSVFFETLFGTAIALLLNSKFKGRTLAKTLLLLPLVATPVAVGLVFTLFYDPTIGFMNFILYSLGLPQSGWHTSESTVMFSLIIVDIWQWTPMIALMSLAGLAGISDEPYESAMVDGANYRQTLFHITIPMLLPTILTALILRSIEALKTYDIIFSMTKGGPGYSSETLNILAYKFSFEYFNMGQGAVILIVLFALVVLFSLGVMKLRKLTEV